VCLIIQVVVIIVQILPVKGEKRKKKKADILGESMLAA